MMINHTLTNYNGCNAQLKRELILAHAIMISGVLWGGYIFGQMMSSTSAACSHALSMTSGKISSLSPVMSSVLGSNEG